MHNSSNTPTGLSDLTHSLLFVKLNAFEGFRGGAFTFSIFKNNFFKNLFYAMLIYLL
jgi:hypothetical protein